MAKSKIADIKCLLLKSLGNDFDIIDQQIATLTGPGDHYGSVMLALDLKIRRTATKGEDETLHLAAKLLPVNEMLRVAFDVETTFKKELLAYTQAIPAIVDFQREFRVPEERIFYELFPKCLGARVSLDENSNKVDEDAVLIFENLKNQGFYTEDRLIGFDFCSTKMILKDLANFHATIIALKLIRSDVFDKKIMPCLVKNGGLKMWPKQVLNAYNDSIMEGARDVPILEPYLEKLQKICDSALTQSDHVNDPWGTMCHMDFWTSNVMVSKDDKDTPIKNKILDLQLIVYSSCIRDLVFFLFTSVMNEVLEKNFQDFLKIYHERFLTILGDFSIDLNPYSWKSFQNEFDEVGRSEIFHILFMLKPICTEKNKIQNSAENFQDSDWTRKDLLGPNHRRKLKDTVLEFVKREWLQ